MLIAMFLSGVLLYVIGSIWERHERSERERRWDERTGSRRPPER